MQFSVDILRKVNCCKLKNELISHYKTYLVRIVLRCLCGNMSNGRNWEHREASKISFQGHI